MNRPSSTRVALILVVSALGCAGVSGWGACPASYTAAAEARGVELPCKVLRDPGLLVERAHAAYDVGNYELAYRQFALIHTLHPESSENRQVFPLAARLFVGFYMPRRTDPSSPWVAVEPSFMFGWLEQFFGDGGEFPQPQVDALFRGLHYGMLRDFLAYAKTRPSLSDWQFSAEKDNGIIESVTGRRLRDRMTPSGAAAN